MNLVESAKNQSWQDIIQYSSLEIAESLSFEDGLRVAYRLLYNDDWNENLQNFAIELLYSIRKIWPEKWNKSWEYNALLGLACEIRYRHEERYQAYKEAFEEASNPPPQLLIEFARCVICPGNPPITYEQAIALVMQALNHGMYTDGISLLCNIYSLKKDSVNKELWTNVLKNSTELALPPVEPKFLVEEFLQDKGAKH